MDVIDVNKRKLQEVDIKGHYGLFTDLLVDRSTIPEGVNCYELRYGDDDSYPADLELNVRVNYFGTVLLADKMDLGLAGMIPLSQEDFGYTGEELSMSEYQANYGEEPQTLSSAGELVQFMDDNDMLIHMTEKEAELLLGYLSGHDYLLGEKDGRLFRGDLCYAHGVTRWKEDTIDDAVDSVCEWNYDLIQEAEAEVENPKDFVDFANKKSRLDSLREDEKMLDSMFERTKYGKEIAELAEKLADELIENMQSKEGIDGAIARMTQEIAEGKDMLPDVSSALKQTAGRTR